MLDHTTIISLKPTLARKRAIMINDALPGIILLINGISYWGDDSPHGKFAVLNILVGVAVLIAFRLELKHESKHKVVSWFDIIAGIVLMVEGINHYHGGKIFQPAPFYFLIGAFVVIRGVFHSRFPTIRKLMFNEEGFILRPNPFRRLRMKWKDLTSCTIDKNTIKIKAKDGKIYRVNLRRTENREEIFNALKTHIKPLLSNTINN
jgi:uncharacterized membrane protein HdeD (DUF308 family)